MPVVDFSDEEFLIVEHYLRHGAEATARELSKLRSSRETRAAGNVNRDAHRLANEFREWWDNERTN